MEALTLWCAVSAVIAGLLGLQKSVQANPVVSSFMIRWFVLFGMGVVAFLGLTAG